MSWPEGSLMLNLEALAGTGCIIPTEQRTALELSLPLKKQEASLTSLQLWGRIITTSGKDYLIAQGTSRAYAYQKKYVFDSKCYYSQDGVKWMDLQPASEDAYEWSKSIVGGFTGDAGHVYQVPDESEPPAPEPPPPAPPAEEGEEGEAEAETAEPEPEPEPEPVEEADQEDQEPPPIPTHPVGELERLAAVIRAVDEDNGVMPLDAMLLNAHNDLIFNKSFAGLSYPNKLESYVHIRHGPSEAPLSKDIQGVWSMQYNPFTTVAILRSLLWPGYSFYYCQASNTFGSLYFGMGEKNLDIAFMI